MIRILRILAREEKRAIETIGGSRIPPKNVSESTNSNSQ